MALKMFYRGPSSRLETLIEKIQQTKEGMCSKFKLTIQLEVLANNLHLKFKSEQMIRNFFAICTFAPITYTVI